MQLTIYIYISILFMIFHLCFVIKGLHFPWHYRIILSVSSNMFTIWGVYIFFSIDFIFIQYTTRFSFFFVFIWIICFSFIHEIAHSLIWMSCSLSIFNCIVLATYSFNKSHYFNAVALILMGKNIPHLFKFSTVSWLSSHIFSLNFKISLPRSIKIILWYWIRL